MYILIRRVVSKRLGIEIRMFHLSLKARALNGQNFNVMELFEVLKIESIGTKIGLPL